MLRESATFPVAIVRPSLVGCVGGLPQPGCAAAPSHMLTRCGVWSAGGTRSSTRRHTWARSSPLARLSQTHMPQ